MYAGLKGYIWLVMVGRCGNVQAYGLKDYASLVMVGRCGNSEVATRAASAVGKQREKW